MSSQGFVGSRTLSANGTYKIAQSPMPIVGTYTLQMTLSTSPAFAGTAVFYLRRTAVDDVAVGSVTTAFQRAGSTSDVAAATDIVALGNDIYYVRGDSTELYVTIASYTAGTVRFDWAWAAG